MTDTTNDVAEEARGDFDLRAHLTGLKRRSGKHTAFTDEITGEEHREVLERIKQIEALVREAIVDPESGEDILPARDLTLDELETLGELRTRARDLAKTLHSSALSFEFTALPPKAVDVCRAKARRASKDIEDEIERKTLHDQTFLAYLLVGAVKKFTVHSEDRSFEHLGFDSAIALGDLLPASEYRRLDVAFAKVQFSEAIAHNAVADADF